MGSSALDILALAVGAAVALIISAVLYVALRTDDARRGWLAAAALFIVLGAAGVIDLLRYHPRQTTFSTVIVGVALPVLGTLGVLRGTRRVRRWLRWSLAFLSAFLLLFGGMLFGAMLARWLPM